MRWLTELWSSGNTVVRVVLVLAVVAVIWMVLWMTGGVDVVGGWLSSN